MLLSTEILYDIEASLVLLEIGMLSVGFKLKQEAFSMTTSNAISRTTVSKLGLFVFILINFHIESIMIFNNSDILKI